MRRMSLSLQRRSNAHGFELHIPIKYATEDLHVRIYAKDYGQYIYSVVEKRVLTPLLTSSDAAQAENPR
jgi:hypothetical protein